jgi:hypothetical protein
MTSNVAVINMIKGATLQATSKLWITSVKLWKELWVLGLIWLSLSLSHTHFSHSWSKSVCECVYVCENFSFFWAEEITENSL